MDNPWVVAIVGGVFSILAYELLKKVFDKVSGTGPRGFPRPRIVVLSVLLSIGLISFGFVLEPMVKSLFEGSWDLMELLAAQRALHPGDSLLMPLSSALIPGIVTGLSSVRGHTLMQRIVFASVAAIASLWVYDTITFFALRSDRLASSIPQVESLADFGQLYFSLISDFVGGPVTGTIVGVFTHLMVTSRWADRTPSRTPA